MRPYIFPLSARIYIIFWLFQAVDSYSQADRYNLSFVVVIMIIVVQFTCYSYPFLYISSELKVLVKMKVPKLPRFPSDFPHYWLSLLL